MVKPAPADTTGIRLNRFTLRFDSKSEPEFFAASLERSLAVVRYMMLALVGGLATQIGVRIFMHGLLHMWTYMPVVEIGCIVLCAILLAASFIRLKFWHYAVLTLLLQTGLGFILLFTMTLILLATIPIPFLLRATGVLTPSLTFMWVLYTDPKFAPVAHAGVIDEIIIATILSLTVAYVLEHYRRSEYMLTCAVNLERTKARQLLENVFPMEIVDRLQGLAPGRAIVDHVAEASVLFADIVGFTEWSAKNSPAEVVRVLNQLFSRFDAIVDQLKVEKIKTIGDAYMAVSGIPTPNPDHVQTIAELALEMREAVVKYRHLTGTPLEVRIGVHTGPVVAGVIGARRFLYDLWGDTVNTASRLEQSSVPGEIRISAEVAACLAPTYEVEPRGMVKLKGKGEVAAFALARPRLLASGPTL
jgi:class 3 adenylate cyclase